jgi:2-aminomuconate deaminase
MGKIESHVVERNAKPRGKYPHVKRAGDFLIVSGTSARRADNSIAGALVDAMGSTNLDIREQTRAVIDNVRDILRTQNANCRQVDEVTSDLASM